MFLVCNGTNSSILWTMAEHNSPFLAQVIDSKDKPTWRLDAIAPKTVWIVNTVHIERRSWRTLDGALSDVERKMGKDFPPLTIFPNPSSFPNEHMGWVGHEQQLI